MSNRPVAIVGAGGFIGRALALRLAAQGRAVIAILRRDEPLPASVERRVAGALSAASPWPALIAGAGAIVHLASRAHQPATSDERWIDEDAATAAAIGDAAAERLIFVSSIKVHGEASTAPFTAAMTPAPRDAYGRAKLRTEERLRGALGPRLVVLRPPLVYGPGVKGNFRTLIGLVERGLPLPLAGIDNRRSLIGLGNLLDLIETALSHPAAPGGTFLMRDDEEVATPDLIRRIARQLGRPARLWPCPPALLRGAAHLLRRGGAIERLAGSLQVDDRATRARLGLRPRVSLDEGLAETCRWFRDRRAAPERTAA
jgi:nucleoside-diphosphate-sugar epimerase